VASSQQPGVCSLYVCQHHDAGMPELCPSQRDAGPIDTQLAQEYD